MAKIYNYESPFETHKRIKKDNIIRDYLDCSSDIISGKVTPNRVMARLGERYNLARQSVFYLLKKSGVYINASTPVVVDLNVKRIS